MSDDRLARALHAYWGETPGRVRSSMTTSALRFGLEWADANPQPADGSTSDGYHTFNELYEYRMLYNAHAAHGWLAQGIPVVKSWRHADGEECFGGGWFIVTATLPAGQVSNHYEARHWGLFKVPEVDVPPVWDGHTPEDAARRLRVEAEHANPQPRAITTSEEMDALPLGTVVLSDKGHAWQKVPHRAGFMSTDGWLCADPIYPGIYNDPDAQKGAIFYSGPATILYRPEVVDDE